MLMGTVIGASLFALIGLFSGACPCTHTSVEPHAEAGPMKRPQRIVRGIARIGKCAFARPVDEPKKEASPQSANVSLPQWPAAQQTEDAG